MLDFKILNYVKYFQLYTFNRWIFIKDQLKGLISDHKNGSYKIKADRVKKSTSTYLGMSELKKVAFNNHLGNLSFQIPKVGFSNLTRFLAKNWFRCAACFTTKALNHRDST